MPLFLGAADILGGLLGAGDILGLGLGAAEEAAPLALDVGAGATAADLAGAGATAADLAGAGATAADLAGAGATAADLAGAGATAADLAGTGATAADLGAAGATDVLAGQAPAEALLSGAQTADLASTLGGLGTLDQLASLGNVGGVVSDVGGPTGFGGLGLGGNVAVPGAVAAPVSGGGVVAPSAEFAGEVGSGDLTDLTAVSSGVGGNVPPTADASAGSMLSPAGQGIVPPTSGASAGNMLTPVNQSLAGLPDTAPGAFGAANAPSSQQVPAPVKPPGGGGGGGGSGLFGTGISGNTALLAGAGLAPLAVTMLRGEQPLPQQAQQLQQLTNPLQGFSQQQLAQYQANQVNPAQQAQLDATRQALTNQWRQVLMNQGVTVPENDTRWPQILAQIDQQVMQSQGQMLANNLQGAFQASGQAGQQLATLANMQVQQDAAYQQAINEATRAAGTVIGLGAASGKLF